jgi:hypothetical protein
VEIQTACKTLTANGDTFFYVYNSSFPTALDEVHTFFVDPYQWHQGLTDYQLVVQSAVQFPDQVSLVYAQDSPASQTPSLSVFDVEIGYLPNVAAADFSNFTLLASVINGTTVYPSTPPDHYNAELDLNTPFVLVVRARDPTVRSTVALSILNDATFQWFGLDAAGNRIAAEPWPLNFTQLRPYFSYVDKNEFATCTQSCLELPVLNGGAGIDGYAIVPSFARALLPANGYQINLPFSFDLTTYNGLNFGGQQGRRLLSEDESNANRRLLSERRELLGFNANTYTGSAGLSIRFSTLSVNTTTTTPAPTTTTSAPASGCTVVLPVPVNAELLSLGSVNNTVQTATVSVAFAAAGGYAVAVASALFLL